MNLITMDPCRICGNPTEPTDKTVLCSGPCAKFFHPGCVGLNSTNHKAWTANVGLLWFCDICRVNFNPVVMDRETVLLKTLRDLLVRVDSMDLRIGQYGENLKILNTMLSAVPNRRESSASNRFHQLLSGCSSGNAHVDFHSSIDRINLNSSLQSLIENCSATEDGLVTLSPIVENNSGNQLADNQTMNSALTKPNATTATVPATSAVTAITTAAINPATTTTASSPAIVAAAAASAAVASASTNPATSSATNPAASVTTATSATAAITTAAITTTVITPATTTSTTTPADVASATVAVTSASTNPAASSATNPAASSAINPAASASECRLRIANRNQRQRETNEEVLRSFYVTPFAIDQTEADILEFIKEISNVGNSTLRCAKLVPRGKNIDELTFISFKVTVSDNLANIVGDSFYWPEGVQIRDFESKNGNRPVSLQQS